MRGFYEAMKELRPFDNHYAFNAPDPFKGDHG